MSTGREFQERAVFYKGPFENLDLGTRQPLDSERKSAFSFVGLNSG